MFKKIKELAASRGGFGKLVSYYLAMPSTKKGIILLVGIAGYSFDPALIDQIITGVLAGIALVEVAREEKKN